LQKKKLHKLYSSNIKVNKGRIRWPGHVQMRDMRNVYKILITEPEGMRSLSALGFRWDYNIKMDLKETGC
jgi:hypothetical protein